MENNIENNLKKAFRNRKIQPSANAWNLLESKLENAETKKKSIFFKYLAYISIFIGLFLSLYIFIKPNKTSVNQKEFITKEAPDLKFENIKPKSEIVQVYRKEKIEKRKKERGATKKNKAKNTAKARKKMEIKKKREKYREENIEKKNKYFTNKITTEKQKILVKKISKTKKNIFTSDEELDQILANAINKELAKKNNSKSKIKIKKNQLLFSLENEINKPIKTKLLDKLLKGAQTVDDYLSKN